MEEKEKPSLDELQERVDELTQYALSLRQKIEININIYKGVGDRDYGITNFESKSSIKIGG